MKASTNTAFEILKVCQNGSLTMKESIPNHYDQSQPLQLEPSKRNSVLSTLGPSRKSAKQRTARN